MYEANLCLETFNLYRGQCVAHYDLPHSQSWFQGNIVSCTKNQIRLWTVNGTLLAETPLMLSSSVRVLCCAVSEVSGVGLCCFVLLHVRRSLLTSYPSLHVSLFFSLAV